MTAARGSSALERDERWARVAWSFLVEPRSGPLVRRLAEYGAVESLARLREGRDGSAPELGVRLRLLDLDGLAHAVRQRDVSVLVPGDPEWPAALDRHEAPPYCLFVHGEPDLAALAGRAVAVVGSRAASDYGLRVAAELGEGLAERGWAVVSGGAFGIDAAAHRGALAADGLTVAVLACGVDVAYPRAHEALLGEVGRRGSLVSEVPVGSAPYRHRFLARNRLIALLARATVVVEAGVRSGALSTAREARDHHLPVGAVPGPVTSATSAGCHRLVRDTGAVLVTDAGEVVELAAPIGEGLTAAAGNLAPGHGEAELDPVAYRVWSTVPVNRPATTERLALAAGVGGTELAAALATLESAGLVVREAGCWRKPRAPRRPRERREAGVDVGPSAGHRM